MGAMYTRCRWVARWSTPIHALLPLRRRVLPRQMEGDDVSSGGHTLKDVAIAGSRIGYVRSATPYVPARREPQ